MKLLDSLFTIKESSHSDDTFKYSLQLNPEHFIYKAHFPGEPITPGVCILQIAVELASLAYGAALEVKTVKNIKFLRIISPVETPEVDYTLQLSQQDEENIKVQVSATYADKTYAKLSIICRK